MRCVYEAANGVEAHMIANLLQQEDIQTRIDGEHLAGGVGELPAIGLVRVMAEEADYERARDIIRRWEAKNPADRTERVVSKTSAPMWFMAGVIATVAVTALLRKSVTTEDGIDFNNDGRLDLRYIVSGRYISRVESDRNLDGRIDAADDYNAQGLPVSAVIDNDFDGRFETKTAFERSVAKRVETDLDGDGSIDIRQDYVDGVLKEVTYYASNGNRVKKREFYERGLLARAELDTDDDGIADVSDRYDRYGEIVETTRR